MYLKVFSDIEQSFKCFDCKKISGPKKCLNNESNFDERKYYTFINFSFLSTTRQHIKKLNQENIVRKTI